MRLPDKVTAYNESVLPYFPIVLELLKISGTTPPKLYAKVSRKFGDDISLYAETIDALFALGEIDFAEGTEVLEYVGGDSM